MTGRAPAFRPKETRHANGIFMHAERVEAGDGVPDTLTWASNGPGTA